MLGINNYKWPTYDESILKENNTNIVIQINGKKRGLINVELNTEENQILKIINKDEKIFKYLKDKEIKKKIYIVNKLLNIIV